MSKEIENYVKSFTDEIIVKRSQTMTNAILGEIKEIATDNGITTEIEINEPFVLELVRKSQPRKPKWLLREFAVCKCGRILRQEEKTRCSVYCDMCGQRIDWGR